MEYQMILGYDVLEIVEQLGINGQIKLEVHIVVQRDN
jgi:hypothetical protein